MGVVVSSTSAVNFSASRSRDFDFSDLAPKPNRYKPESIDQLCATTKFTRSELQAMYRGFKQECPSGVVDQDTFKQIMAQFFPQGCSDDYATHVFKIFDINKNGVVSFEEFVRGLSLLSRGSVEEKLRWSFNLYDSNRDGMLTKEEILIVVKSIYQMLGRWSSPPIDDETANQHVDRIFREMDKNDDGIITYEEFMEYCRSNDTIIDNMTNLDTILL